MAIILGGCCSSGTYTFPSAQDSKDYKFSHVIPPPGTMVVGELANGATYELLVSATLVSLDLHLEEGVEAIFEENWFEVVTNNQTKKLEFESLQEWGSAGYSDVPFSKMLIGGTYESKGPFGGTKREAKFWHVSQVSSDTLPSEFALRLPAMSFNGSVRSQEVILFRNVTKKMTFCPPWN
jgi:hypothetical protein